MSAMDEVREILAEHVKHTRYLCNSVSLAPIMVSHGSGREPQALTLQCSKDVDALGRHADGDPVHKDMVHCYSFHKFGPDLGTDETRNPRDRSTCVKCMKLWPCDAVRIAELTQHADAV